MVLDLITTKTNDGYTAEIPSLKGCESWDHNEDAVIEKILDLASFYLRIEKKNFKLDRARRVENKIIYKLVFNKDHL